jgi:tetratricopeptide (TPR) repeat protein
VTQFYRNLLIFNLLIFLLSLPGFLEAQESNTLKLAKSLEKTGQYEESLKLYQKLFDGGTETFQVIEGIKNNLIELRRYDDLILFFSNLVEKNPQQINYLIDLGKAWYLKGDEKNAFRCWKETIESAPQNPTVYRLVGLTMIDLRLFDDAIKIYEQAIKNVKGQESLYRDIAALYKAQLNYEKAVQNLLLFYTYFQKQFGYVQSQIISMTSDEEAVNRIISAIKEFLKENYSNEDLRELLASMYIKNKEFEKAFEIYGDLQSKNIDQNFLHRFASEAENSAEYTFAIRAYESLLKNNLNESRKLNYEFNLAKDYYYLGLMRSKNGDPVQAETNIQTAIQKFDQLISGKNPVFKARSMEFKADIYREYYNDLDNAVNLYGNALNLRINNDFLDAIRLKLGNVWLEKNDLKKAQKLFGQMKSLKYQYLGKFNQAEIEYFSGNFKTAKEEYQQLLSNLQPVDSLTNNILDRIMFIDKNSKDSVSLAKFSEAELLVRQRKESEAARLFSEIAQGNHKMSLDAGLRAADLYKKLRKYDQAEKVLTLLVENYSENNRIDNALYELGEIYFVQKKYESGLKTYQKILLNYPSSFYIEDARKKARLISGILKENTKK